MVGLLGALAGAPASAGETGNWKLETGNLKLETGNWKLQNRRVKTANPKSKIQNLKSPAPSPGYRWPSLQLLAPPVLSYATYLGGAGFDIATAVAVDSSGSVYVAGYTNSLALPAAGGGLIERGSGTCGAGLDLYPCFDVFVARLDPSGRNLAGLAIFGGSGDDFATGLALDGNGNVYVAGYTNSSDFPVANAAQALPGGGACGSVPCFDAFVAKLDSSGANLIYATYLGGGADDYAQAIAVDAAGEAVVTGFTASPDFPVAAALFGSRAGGYDAFVSKLDAGGRALQFSTFLGGAGDDFGAALALDGAGQIYLAGSTNSADFPELGGFQSAYAAGVCGALSSTTPCFDAFVAKLPADGARLEFSTFLGGMGSDYGYGVAVDAAGSACVTGLTTSQDFPVTFRAFQTAGGGASTDAFVTKLDPSGAALIYSTYLGGILAESGVSVAVDSSGRAYVAGSTYGSAFPLVNPIQPASGGFFDAFLAVLNDAGTALEFSTYLGGSGNDKARGLALDFLGNVVVAGETFSEDFPMARAFQSDYAGGPFDSFLVNVTLADSPVLYASPAQIDFGEQFVGTTSAPRAVTLTNIAGGELNFESITTSGDFSLSGECGPLGAGASCELAVAFAPAASGVRAGALTILSNGASSAVTVSLTGTGVAPEISLSPESITFGHQLVGTVSSPQAVTLTNTGTAALELSGVHVSGEFTQSNDCAASLDVNSRCTIQIAFAPQSPGARAGGLTVTNSLPQESRTAALAGAGTDFSIGGSHLEATVTAGQAAGFALSVTPVDGFHETVSLACTGAPKAASCSVSPALVPLDGANVVAVSVTVSTRARAATGWRGAPPPPRGFPLLLILLSVGLLATILLAQSLPHPAEPLGASRGGARLALASLVLLALLWSSCGGGGSAPPPPPPPEGTAPGTYTFTVTGVYDGVSRSATLTLNVQ